jgi:hypothetical protein
MKRRPLSSLLSVWNRATNPAALRTDHEARRARTLARIADRQMVRDFREGLSGKRFAVRS